MADRLKRGPNIPEPGAHAQYNPIPLNVGVACNSLLTNRIAEDEEVLQIMVLSLLVFELIERKIILGEPDLIK